MSLTFSGDGFPFVGAPPLARRTHEEAAEDLGERGEEEEDHMDRAMLRSVCVCVGEGETERVLKVKTSSVVQAGPIRGFTLMSIHLWRQHTFML